MKRSMLLAIGLTLILAAPAASSDAVLSGPAMFGIMNGCLNLVGPDFPGESVDGIVGYGAGTGPRRGQDPETDSPVDYGIGTGPRRPHDGTTDGVTPYGTGNGPKRPLGG